MGAEGVGGQGTDWQPDQYLKFKDERTRPSIDLVGRVDLAAPGRIIDIGCGPGNSTAILKARWPAAEVWGLDSSEAMIERARADHPHIHWLRRGAEGDLSDLGAFDLVFSNAALQWMPDQEAVLTNLFGLLAGGGVLAVQVPYTKEMPVYRAILALAKTAKWAGHFGDAPDDVRHHGYPYYYHVLCRLTGDIEMWQTEYIHVMPDAGAIVEWYKSTGLRPWLERLPDEAARGEFCEDHRRLLEEAYPPQRDGRVLFPFARVFFLARK